MKLFIFIYEACKHQVLVDGIMIYNVAVTGTGFEDRDYYIRIFVRPNVPVYLIPEPDNEFDKNAIAVTVEANRFKIGYIKRERARFLTKKLNQGGKILSAKVTRCYMNLRHPEVSIEIEADW